MEPPKGRIPRLFSRIAGTTSAAMGHWVAFAIAAAIVLVWLCTGPLFGFSEVWQLFINTGTTVVTFLMVFLIQHQQNHDTLAIQKKLDELVRSIPEADSDLAEIEREAM